MQILYTRDRTKKFLKITVVCTTAYQVTIQKLFYTVSCKMKNAHDLSPMLIRFDDEFSQTFDFIICFL